MKNYILIITLSSLLFVSCKKEQVEEKQEPSPTAVVKKVDHSKWNQILMQYVDGNGDVNYQGLKSNTVVFDQYLSELESININDDYNNNEKLAYWINVYNAYTIKLIIDNYPVNSINEIANGSPWDTTFIQIGANNYTLNNVEHNIIRQNFNEPRIHFLINCASISCPKLLNEAITGDNLETKLEAQAIDFVNDISKNIVTTNPIQISKIFDWFQVDFINGNSTIIDYLNQYSTNQIPTTNTVGYLTYDWNLNKQ